MLESLHLAVFRRDERAARARFLQRLARAGHLDLLEAVGDDDGDTFAFEVVHGESSCGEERARSGHSTVVGRCQLPVARYEEHSLATGNWQPSLHQPRDGPKLIRPGLDQHLEQRHLGRAELRSLGNHAAQRDVLIRRTA